MHAAHGDLVWSLNVVNSGTTVVGAGAVAHVAARAGSSTSTKKDLLSNASMCSRVLPTSPPVTEIVVSSTASPGGPSMVARDFVVKGWKQLDLPFTSLYRCALFVDRECIGTKLGVLCSNYKEDVAVSMVEEK